MSDKLKAKFIGNCVGGRHVGPFMEEGDLTSVCMSCSIEHVEEFGNSVGVVQGPTDYNNCLPGDPRYDPEKVGPEVDVRWRPFGLRYAYDPDDLVEVL